LEAFFCALVSVKSFSLSLWERAGVRVQGIGAASEAPSPGLRPASPRGRGDKSLRGADDVTYWMVGLGKASLGESTFAADRPVGAGGGVAYILGRNHVRTAEGPHHVAR
jgi:hypothetical protein